MKQKKLLEYLINQRPPCLKEVVQSHPDGVIYQADVLDEIWFRQPYYKDKKGRIIVYWKGAQLLKYKGTRHQHTRRLGKEIRLTYWRHVFDPKKGWKWVYAGQYSLNANIPLFKKLSKYVMSKC